MSEDIPTNFFWVKCVRFSFLQGQDFWRVLKIAGDKLKISKDILYYSFKNDHKSLCDAFLKVGKVNFDELYMNFFKWRQK